METKDFFSKVPTWLIAIVVIVFMLVILEQLYNSKLCLDIWGLKLNQPCESTKSLEYKNETKIISTSGTDPKTIPLKITLPANAKIKNAWHEPMGPPSDYGRFKSVILSFTDREVIMIVAGRDLNPDPEVTLSIHILYEISSD